MSFAHPDGLPSSEWSYADARHVMQSLVRDVFDGEQVPFHITFELNRHVEWSRRKPRHFVIRSARGSAALEPLYLTYLATFGMLAVFASGASASVHDG